jgi:hypothetical protein
VCAAASHGGHCRVVLCALSTMLSSTCPGVARRFLRGRAAASAARWFCTHLCCSWLLLLLLILLLILLLLLLSPSAAAAPPPPFARAQHSQRQDHRLGHQGRLRLHRAAGQGQGVCCWWRARGGGGRGGEGQRGWCRRRHRHDMACCAPTSALSTPVPVAPCPPTLHTNARPHRRRGMPTPSARRPPPTPATTAPCPPRRRSARRCRSPAHAKAP